MEEASFTRDGTGWRRLLGVGKETARKLLFDKRVLSTWTKLLVLAAGPLLGSEIGKTVRESLEKKPFFAHRADVGGNLRGVQ